MRLVARRRERAISRSMNQTLTDKLAERPFPLPTPERLEDVQNQRVYPDEDPDQWPANHVQDVGRPTLRKVFLEFTPRPDVPVPVRDHVGVEHADDQVGDDPRHRIVQKHDAASRFLL